MAWYERYRPEEIAMITVNKLITRAPAGCPLHRVEKFRANLMTEHVRVWNAFVEVTCPGDIDKYYTCQICRIRKKTIYIDPDDGLMPDLSSLNFNVEHVTPHDRDIIGWLLTPPSERKELRYGSK